MKIDVITLFPEMVNASLSDSIIGRARTNNIIDIQCHQLRDFAYNKHKNVDDTPFGGGMGMLMSPEPIYQCFEHIKTTRDCKPHFIYMSPQGSTLTQEKLVELSKLDNICILCGHYEGVDERIIEHYVDEQISIGDFVLTGGELPAAILIDGLCRMAKGVLSNEECFEQESHYNGLIEYPQYTRPSSWQDKKVPDVLLSGHHKNIEQWRREKSIKRTEILIKNALEKAQFTKEEREIFINNIISCTD